VPSRQSAGVAPPGDSDVRGLVIAPVFGHTLASKWERRVRGFPHGWRRGREAEGGGLLNRYRVMTPYRGFESLRLRQQSFIFNGLLTRNCAFPYFLPYLRQGRAPAQ
jgi:hypothetical protein